MPPLGDAMGLVDRDQRESPVAMEGIEHRQRASGEQAFRCDVEQIEATFAQVHLGRPGFLLILTGIEVGSSDAGFSQRADLVVHQRDQWRHDDRGAGAQQRRNLEAQRFAATGGHQHQGVATGCQMFDHRLLLAAEAGIAENVLQDLLRP